MSVINLQVLIKIRNVDEVTWGKCEPEKSLGSPKCSIKVWFVNITPRNSEVKMGVGKDLSNHQFLEKVKVQRMQQTQPGRDVKQTGNEAPIAARSCGN